MFGSKVNIWTVTDLRWRRRLNRVPLNLLEERYKALMLKSACAETLLLAWNRAIIACEDRYRLELCAAFDVLLQVMKLMCERVMTMPAAKSSPIDAETGPRDSHQFWLSESFWRGFAVGFSSQRYLTRRFKIKGDIKEHLASDSVREAWASVWRLLGDTLEENETNGKISTQPTTSYKCQSRTKRPAAHRSHAA